MIEALKPFLPDGALPLVSDLLAGHRYRIAVVRPRKTKLGDFRPDLRGGRHQITVNGDLPPAHFTLTLVHEIAHMKVHDQYGRKVKPHGSEWQTAFTRCMTPFLNARLFDDRITAEMRRYLDKPKASCSADTRLLRVLRESDERHSDTVTVESLPVNAVFQLPGRSPMKVLGKRRTRYLCEELKSGRTFAVHPLAEVKPLNVPDERNLFQP